MWLINQLRKVGHFYFFWFIKEKVPATPAASLATLQMENAAKRAIFKHQFQTQTTLTKLNLSTKPSVIQFILYYPLCKKIWDMPLWSVLPPTKFPSFSPFFGAPWTLLPWAVHVSSTFEFGAVFHDFLSVDPQRNPPFSPFFGGLWTLLHRAIRVSSTFEFGVVFDDCLIANTQGNPPFSPFIRSPMNSLPSAVHVSSISNLELCFMIA